MSEPISLLTIVGPTASGKTELAIRIAEKFDGEIVCADSRTVYRGLDIGSAKPTAAEQARAPHHLLDVVDPDEPFTVADFKRLADESIADIRGRGKLPILVGGSGLYVDAVVYGYQFSSGGVPRDAQNPRHLDGSVPRLRKGLSPDVYMVGIAVGRDVLRRRVADRVEIMVANGFLEEVQRLRKQYPGSKALDAPGYKAFAEYLDGSLDLEGAKQRFVSNDMQLAKRQMTWFNRNKSIHWENHPRKLEDFLTTLLNKKQ